MSETPNLDELREQCRKLLQLLENPEPGLVTWHLAVRDKLSDLAKWTVASE